MHPVDINTRLYVTTPIKAVINNAIVEDLKIIYIGLCSKYITSPMIQVADNGFIRASAKFSLIWRLRFIPKVFNSIIIKKAAVAPMGAPDILICATGIRKKFAASFIAIPIRL